MRHTVTTHPNVAAAAMAHEVPRYQAHHLVPRVTQGYPFVCSCHRLPPPLAHAPSKISWQDHYSVSYPHAVQAKTPRTSDTTTTATDVSTGGCETTIQPIPDSSATTDQNRNHPLHTLLFLLSPLLSAWKAKPYPLRSSALPWMKRFHLREPGGTKMQIPLNGQPQRTPSSLKLS